MRWRDRIAAFKFYADHGRQLCQWLYQWAVGAGAIKLLAPTVPTWALVAAGPPVMAVFWCIGYAHRRWGWMRQEAAVAVQEHTSPTQEVTFEYLARLLEVHRVPLNHLPKTLRPEILHALQERR